MSSARLGTNENKSRQFLVGSLVLLIGLIIGYFLRESRIDDYVERIDASKGVLVNHKPLHDESLHNKSQIVVFDTKNDNKEVPPCDASLPPSKGGCLFKISSSLSKEKPPIEVRDGTTDEVIDSTRILAYDILIKLEIRGSIYQLICYPAGGKIVCH